MMFCKYCSKELPKDSHFCSQCGKSQEGEAPAMSPKTDVGIGTYFGLLLLFMLPIIGVIASLVFALVAKNPNIKNFARAMLIWMLIGAVLCFIVGGLLIWGIADYMFPRYTTWDDVIRYELYDSFDYGDDFDFDHPQLEFYF